MPDRPARSSREISEQIGRHENDEGDQIDKRASASTSALLLLQYSDLSSQDMIP